ncbi:MAG: DUF1549 domain-containing protein [Planctomycetaceae bacterium]|nr:DUF1549 domain-containing protein [Planctomycetaceae bacterium]
MTISVSWSPGQRDDFLTLLDRVCDQRASAADVNAIERIVHDVPEAKSLYVAYLDLHGTLIWDASEEHGPVVPAVAPTSTDKTRRRRKKRLVVSAAAACAALAVGIVVGRMSLGPNNAPDQVVQNDQPARAADTPPVPSPKAPVRVRQPVELVQQSPPSTEIEPPVVPDVPPPINAVVVGVVEPPVSATGDDIANVSLRIDSLLRRNWQDLKITPSLRADDAEWCRRAYLDVVGRIPTVTEAEAFLADQRPDKRRRLTDDLLASGDYARNLSTIWSNLLVGRSPAPQVDRASLKKFLRMSFAANEPWNELVAAMLSAEGRVDENGAANFLVAHLNNQAMPATAVTSQLFFGTQLRCAQCHNHPFTDTKQSAFWELNSLFQQTEVVNSRQMMPREERTGPAVAALVSRADGGPIYFETVTGLMKVAFPRFGGHDIDANPGVNRRQTLANLLTSEDQPQIAAAFVNRVWAHFFGAGFTKPIDDFGTHNPPSQPELFALLRDEFIRSGYDVKQLTRWITSTDAYQLTSRPQAGNQQDDPSTGDLPAFSRVYPKPMSPEQLFDSLVTATQAQQGRAGDWTAAEARRQKWLDEFIVSLDNDENEEEETLTGTYGQAFAVMNGELVQQALDLDPGTFLGDLVRAKTPEPDKIRRLCLAALSRPPTEKELPAMRRVLHDAGLPRRPNASKNVATPGGYQDLFWALLNSNEFATVH